IDLLEELQEQVVSGSVTGVDILPQYGSNAFGDVFVFDRQDSNSVVRMGKHVLKQVTKEIRKQDEAFIVGRLRLSDKSPGGVIIGIYSKKSEEIYLELMVGGENALNTATFTYLTSDGQTSMVFEGLSLADDRWHSIILHLKDLEKSENGIDLYVDCSLVATDVTESPISQHIPKKVWQAEFYLGQREPSGLFTFNGSLQGLHVVFGTDINYVIESSQCAMLSDTNYISGS
ncbi:thrombospondin-4-like, partial [Saccoglossus kowalevskii]|uniref:Thrombospondin-3-like n=1 Tax=Saccoglossus kowalevskii TaxID=10224 RepID=A0ABM0M2F7_SACKO